MQKRFAGLVMALVCAVSACSAGQDMGAATQAVEQFHAAYTESQFDRIYADASEDLTQTATREAFAATMGDMRRRLGGYRSGSRTGFNVNYDKSGNFVAMGFASVFEHGQASEEFTYRMIDGRPRLAGYRFNITSLDSGAANAAAPAPSQEAGNGAATQ